MTNTNENEQGQVPASQPEAAHQPTPALNLADTAQQNEAASVPLEAAEQLIDAQATAEQVTDVQPAVEQGVAAPLEAAEQAVPAQQTVYEQQPQVDVAQYEQPYQQPYQQHVPYQAEATYPQPEEVYVAPVNPVTADEAAKAAAREEKLKKRKKLRPITMAATAGIAIGAVIGGTIGGGIATYVTTGALPAGNAAATGGTITVNNANDASQVTAVAATATPSVVTLSVASNSSAGEGSGVILNEDGYIATNAHVVTLDGDSLDTKIVVTLSDGRRYNAKLVGYDPYADLAVVKISAKGLTPIEFANSDKLNVGDATVAIGAPLSYANSVTSGVVSALNRGISVSSSLVPNETQSGEDQQSQQQNQQNQQGQQQNGLPWEFRFFNQQSEEGNGTEQQQSTSSSSEGTITLSVIQTDASINQGNSGGALLNAKGQLIGINVALAGADGSSGNVGLGFAIPANLVKRITSEIIAGEQPTHGLLGVGVSDSTSDEDEDANHLGALLVNVTKGGAADEAGLKAGDVITAVNGVPVSDGTALSGLIRTYAGGSEVTLSYSRGGKYGDAKVKLGTLTLE